MPCRPQMDASLFLRCKARTVVYLLFRSCQTVLARESRRFSPSEGLPIAICVVARSVKNQLVPKS